MDTETEMEIRKKRKVLNDINYRSNYDKIF